MYYRKYETHFVVGFSDDPPAMRRCVVNPAIEHSFSRLLMNDVYFLKSKATHLCYTNSHNPKRQVIEASTLKPDNSDNSTCRSSFWLIIFVVLLLVVIALAAYLFLSREQSLGRKCREKIESLLSKFKGLKRSG